MVSRWPVAANDVIPTDGSEVLRVAPALSSWSSTMSGPSKGNH